MATALPTSTTRLPHYPCLCVPSPSAAALAPATVLATPACQRWVWCRQLAPVPLVAGILANTTHLPQHLLLLCHLCLCCCTSTPAGNTGVAALGVVPAACPGALVVTAVSDMDGVGGPVTTLPPGATLCRCLTPGTSHRGCWLHQVGALSYNISYNMSYNT